MLYLTGISKTAWKVVQELRYDPEVEFSPSTVQENGIISSAMCQIKHVYLPFFQKNMMFLVI